MRIGDKDADLFGDAYSGLYELGEIVESVVICLPKPYSVPDLRSAGRSIEK